jgi:hypothetical protein
VDVLLTGEKFDTLHELGDVTRQLLFWHGVLGTRRHMNHAVRAGRGRPASA